MSERRWDAACATWVTVLDEAGPRPAAGTGPGTVAVVPLGDPAPPGTPGTALRPVRPVGAARELLVHPPDATADPGHCRLLIEVWAERYRALGRREDVAYVLLSQHAASSGPGAGGRPGAAQPGAAQPGAAQPGAGTGAAGHEQPHGHVEGRPVIPARALLELETGREQLLAHGRCTWCDTVAAERAEGARVVAADPHFLLYVPFAARFPYELHLATARHATSLLDLSGPERSSMAALLGRAARCYEDLTGRPAAYDLVVHQAPTDDGPWLPVSHLHVELVPADDGPRHLLEEPVNPLPPEQAAARLRAVPGS